MGKKIIAGNFNFPKPRNLPVTNTTLNHFFKRVYSNAFGLLSQVFRIFCSTISILPETCANLTLVACCLHNMLRDGYLESSSQSIFQFISQDTTEIHNMRPWNHAGGFGGKGEFDARDQLKDFFNSDAGAVSWQDNRINRLN